MLLRASVGPVVHDGVDRSQVAALLEHLAPGGVALILERLDLEHDQHYIEARCLGPLWEVECREGDAAHHYRVELDSSEEVLDLLMAWSARVEGWRDSLPWQRLPLTPSVPAHSDAGPHDWSRSDRL